MKMLLTIIHLVRKLPRSCLPCGAKNQNGRSKTVSKNQRSAVSLSIRLPFVQNSDCSRSVSTLDTTSDSDSDDDVVVVSKKHFVPRTRSQILGRSSLLGGKGSRGVILDLPAILEPSDDVGSENAENQKRRVYKEMKMLLQMMVTVIGLF